MSVATFTPSYILSVGDGAVADAINLLNVSQGTKVFFTQDSFTWANGQGKGVLAIQGADARWSWRAYDEVARLFRHGTQAASPSGHGVRATIGCQVAPDQCLYLDVVSGQLAETPNIAIDNRTLLVPMTFTTLDYARGEPQYDTATATLTNGSTSVVYRDLIPGTAPALVRVELIDSSTSTLVINRARIGVWSDRYLYSAGGFPGIISGSGSITASNTWQDIASYTVTARGLFAFLVKGTDSATATSAKVTISSATNNYSAGSLPVGGYTYQVVALDAGNKVLAISAPRYVHSFSEGGSGNHQTALVWSAVAGAADHRVYWKRDFNDWLYLATGSSGASYTHSTESGATTANPPKTADSSLTNALLRAVVKLPSGAVVRTYPPVSFQLSNGKSEWLLPLVDTLPPIGRGESALTDSCVVTVQGKSGGSNAPTVTAGAAVLLPRNEGQYAEAWFRTADLATKRTLVFDPDRTGAMRAYFTDGSGTFTNPADCTPDALQVEPGGALFMAALEGAGGVADFTDLKVQFRLTIIPRYASLGGLPWL